MYGQIRDFTVSLKHKTNDKLAQKHPESFSKENTCSYLMFGEDKTFLCVIKLAEKFNSR